MPASFKKPSDIKVGVIGYGGAFNMGKKHLEEMHKAGMTPVAVCEVDPARLQVAESDFPGIQTYAKVADLLKKSDVNLIVIITPHNTHAPLALQCLRAGRHVVCEKPLAITTKECDAMIAAATKSGVVLSTYHNRHWDGCVLEAVDRIVKQKQIGAVYRIEAHMGQWGQPQDWWRTSKTISGGVLYDWGVHLLEYALQILDSDLTEVSGYAHVGHWAPKTAWKKDTNEDEACALARFQNGAWLNLNISTLDANPKRGILEITGTQGSYLMDHGTFEITQPGPTQTQVIRGKNRPGAQHLYYQNIADHLTGKAKLVITPQWSRRPIHILDLAVQSANKGKALPAQYP
jgi:predicted dehydrogenase